jgi:FMN phosphatase YigB (HAD superfamily)
MKTTSLFVSLYFLVSPCSTTAKVVIFDLGGVIFKQSSLMSFWDIGPRKFFGWHNPLSIEATVFKFLHLLESRKSPAAATHHDMPLPQIMCDWLAGTKTTAAIRAQIQAGLKQHTTFFSGSSQRNLVHAITQFMFSPERLVKTIYPVKSGVKLLKRCYNKRDDQGNRVNRVYILSNWDKESFELLYQKPRFKKIFNYCDGIVISGYIGLIKPDLAIFEHLLDTHKIYPDNEFTVFIDDQEANLTAALAAGINTIHCENFNFRAVKKTLKNAGIL